MGKWCFSWRLATKKENRKGFTPETQAKVRNSEEGGKESVAKKRSKQN